MYIWRICRKTFSSSHISQHLEIGNPSIGARDNLYHFSFTDLATKIWGYMV